MKRTNMAQKVDHQETQAPRNKVRENVVLLEWSPLLAAEAGLLGNRDASVTESRIESVACPNALIGWG